MKYLVIAAVLFFSQWNVADCPNPEKIRETNVKFKSENFLVSTKGWEVMYAYGSHAIPFLLANLDDDSRYYGLCGAGILKSQAIDSRKVKDKNNYPDDYYEITVRDASLYLILAILRGDLYFAGNCEPHCSEGKLDFAFKAATKLIRERYVEYLKGEVSFEYKDVTDILSSCRISYKQ